MNRKTLLQYMTTCMIMTIGGYFLSYLIITCVLPQNQLQRMQDSFDANLNNCITIHTKSELTQN